MNYFILNDTKKKQKETQELQSEEGTSETTTDKCQPNHNNGTATKDEDCTQLKDEDCTQLKDVNATTTTVIRMCDERLDNSSCTNANGDDGSDIQVNSSKYVAIYWQSLTFTLNTV